MRLRTLFGLSLLANIALVLLWIVLPSGDVSSVFSRYPVTSEVWSWPHQDDLIVNQVSAEAIDPKLNLFFDKFRMQYRIIGSLQHLRNDGFKPYIWGFQITYRINVTEGAVPYTASADVLVVPIVEVAQDASYHGEKIPFDIAVQQSLRTFKWGANTYNIRCGNQTCSATVARVK